MFEKILIANRGEIACRIATTCKQLGIKTVAVYSEADRHAQHARFCDEAIYIGSAEARDSYLCIDRLIAAAQKSKAQAIHPGYGFLSENAQFAQACAEAGLVFIGPPIAAIEAMGSKSAAKTLMAKANIPLVPGYHGARQEIDFLQQQAQQIGYPILLKASAGGGGKGMRIVHNDHDFASAFQACQREAQHSFGDNHILLEKYLEKPRHIEIQIFADQFGNCVHLFERDCSIQRRHQKVLEEAPAPHFSAEQRAQMGRTAIAAAQAVGYVGAGTVEFIVDASENSSGTFYFMEMNTRLQVEHPVTEMITKQDLVTWQLQVAAGQPLPLQQDQLQIKGHAIEVRIYAENPEKDFLPTTGKLEYLHLPKEACYFSSIANTRVDTGVACGDSISPYYDPMIAKLITWGETRQQAILQLRQALREFRIAGLNTNLAFLNRLAHTQAFAAADLDTGFIARHHATLFPEATTPSLALIAGAVAAQLTQEGTQSCTYANLTDQNDGEHPISSPWGKNDGWRIHRNYRRHLHFMYNDQKISTTLSYTAQGLQLNTAAHAEPSSTYFLRYRHHGGTRYTVQLTNQTQSNSEHSEHYDLDIFSKADHFYLYDATHSAHFHYLNPLQKTRDEEDAANKLTAPMPGKILAIHATHGQTVSKGTPLLVMEAMKMEHTISAPRDGIIEAIHFTQGEQVMEGVELLSLSVTE